jgi:hypothetical protein
VALKYFIFSVSYGQLPLSTLVHVPTAPHIFHQGQVVEMTVNVRALQIVGRKNVMLHMDSLILHDRHGVAVSDHLYMENIGS